MLTLLEGVYGPRIKVSLAELSSSIIVRSEHQYHRDERWRLSLRKHLYELQDVEPEKLGAAGPMYRLTPGALKALSQTEVRPLLERLSSLLARDPMGREDFEQALRDVLSQAELAEHQRTILQYSSGALRCLVIEEGDRFGRYLGFMDLRPNSTRSPLAMALLAPPRRFTHDRDTFIITGEYGPMFGATGFPCTVYSMHDPEMGGARCGQASVIMALGALADRGAGFLGSYTLTYLAKEQKAEPFTPSPDNPRCLASQAVEGEEPPRSFEVGGLNAEAMHRLLKGRNVSPSLIRVPRGDEGWRTAYLVLRLIEAYIRARFPVIMAVNCQRWWWWAPKDVEHAVTVVGVRGSSPDPRRNSLIIHDPGYIPFLERPLEECLLAAYDYHEKDSVWMVAAADNEVRVHAFECIRRLDSSLEGRFFDDYSPGGPDDRRGYRVALADRDDLVHHLCPPVEFPDRRGHYSLLRSHLRTGLSPARYWCISAAKEGGPRRAWLFDSSRFPARDQDLPWAAMIELAPFSPVGSVVFPGRSGARPTRRAFFPEGLAP